MRWPWQQRPPAANIKLDQPASVFWLEGAPRRQSFDSVTDAVRFVMDDLAEHLRASAWIRIESSSLMIEQIEQLYKKQHRLAFGIAGGRAKPGND
jgi:hypothetical protein